MPNGGSDHCGNCRHNRPNVGREASREERRLYAFCTVRKVAVRASTSTYCANHYVDEKTPIGPMFGSPWDDERVPYHHMSYPRSCTASACKVCGGVSQEGKGVEVTDDKLGALQFCGGRHYVKWWKQIHPGESLMWDCDLAPAGTPGDSSFAEMQAKLELADAYLEMGDKDGARDVLQEVLVRGDGTQKERARRMLERC